MLNILSYIGVNLQSELCLWTLMGLVRTIFDATLFKVNANLKQVWQMSMPPELSMPVQRGLRTMISGVMLVQCFTVYVYLAAYIVLLYPVFLEERPILVLPWLLLAAIRKFLCELTSLALGLGACVLLGPARPPCIKFVVFKVASITPSFYMWMLVFSYYQTLKVASAFKRLPTALVTSDQDYGLELAVRRRRTKSLQHEDQLRRKLVASLYVISTTSVGQNVAVQTAANSDDLANRSTASEHQLRKELVRTLFTHNLLKGIDNVPDDVNEVQIEIKSSEEMLLTSTCSHPLGINRVNYRCCSNYDTRPVHPPFRQKADMPTRVVHSTNADNQDINTNLLCSRPWSRPPSPTSADRISEVGSYEDWCGREIAVPRDADRILEQFVIMSLRIGAFLKTEGTDPSKMFTTSSRELHTFTNVDCGNLQNEETETPPLVGSTKGKTASYLQEYPQIFMKKPTDSMLFVDEPLLTSKQSKHNLKSSRGIVSESQKSVKIADKFDKEPKVEKKIHHTNQPVRLVNKKNEEKIQNNLSYHNDATDVTADHSIGSYNDKNVDQTIRDIKQASQETYNSLKYQINQSIPEKANLDACDDSIEEIIDRMKKNLPQNIRSSKEDKTQFKADQPTSTRILNETNLKHSAPKTKKPNEMQGKQIQQAKIEPPLPETPNENETAAHKSNQIKVSKNITLEKDTLSHQKKGALASKSHKNKSNLKTKDEKSVKDTESQEHNLPIKAKTKTAIQLEGSNQESNNIADSSNTKTTAKDTEETELLEKEEKINEKDI